MSDSLIGKKLGDYHIRELLGKGGMARVYLGFDEHLDRRAAVKVINNDIPAKERDEYFRRFQNEARAIARLDHPNIVRVYQFGEYEDVYYMAMVFVDGKDLRQVLRQAAATGTTLPITETVSIIRQTASALDYAHSQGVIHRDVKPSNIMVTSQGQAILTDFGLALSSTEGTLGETFGSAHYIAPEQAVSSANSVPQSDLYSLGICAFELLTGRVPFDDPSAMSVALKHVNMAPPTLASINPNVPPAFEPVIARALEKEPGKRYPSGAAFADALEATYESRMAYRILGSSTNIRTPNRMSDSWPVAPDKGIDKRPDSSPFRSDPPPSTPGRDNGAALKGAAPSTPRTTYRYGPTSKPDLSPATSKPASKPKIDVVQSDASTNGNALKSPGVGESNPRFRAGTSTPPFIDSDSRLSPPGVRRPAILVALAGVIIVGAIVFTFVAARDNGTNGLPTPTIPGGAVGTNASGGTAQTALAVVPTGTLRSSTPALGASGTILAGATTNALGSDATATEATRNILTPTLQLSPTEPATVNNTVSGTITATPIRETPDALPPTRTLAITPLYVVTAADMPTQSKPSVLLIWDSYQLSFINNSEEYVSVKHLSFVAMTRNETRQFSASQWTRPPDGNYSDLLRPSQCYQIGRFGQLLPQAFSPCTGTAAYWQPSTSGQFWINADERPDAEFEIYYDTTRIATCRIATGRCTVALPDAT